MTKKTLDLSVYFIAGPQNFPECSLDEATQKIALIIKSGVTVYQFRDKGTIYKEQKQRLSIAQKLQKVSEEAGVSFIVNDDVELARELNADGIHIGQTDEPVSKVREKVGQEMWLGLSVTKADELKTAQSSGADYLGIGPIYPTNSKNDAAKPIGIKDLRLMLLENQLPIVGIGGITQDSLTELSAIGLDGLAVISLLTEAENPKKVAQMIRQKITKNE
ncbi:thiamine-phosphate diphosphorylase, thiE [Lactococcus cremoris]|uniref:thiamine phosphate synthase n=1 Tax=Lactococcus lactis subsp. cremoris TaxID=1359 RepID=UPI00062A1F4F|nr:thiamine phosphate synthase [Lactococcus cremoris]KKW72959.1 thiamine-phosphate diphosphorylase, thiE [Lactococcus cremoris]MDR9868584.1 thiamine phosphate synthase [Lactococcus cremoris]RDG23777.1 thiamine phosphate synthase [Lactococcus cremoris]